MQRADVALMYADIRGYSRLLELNESEALEILNAHQSISEQVISEYHGNLVRRLDDSLIASFASPNDAYLCALDFLHRIKAFNLDKQKPRRLLVSIGLHKGKADVRNGLVTGEQVNVVARLQNMAEPGSICLSNAMYASLSKMLDIKVIEYRDVEIENLPGNHHVYKTLSIYRDEFKTERPSIHIKSDYHYRIKEIQHLKGNGVSFLSTGIYAMLTLSVLFIVVAALLSHRTQVNFSELLGSWLNTPTPYLILIPLSVLISMLYTRRKMRAVFDDVKEVDRILSYIMSQLGYRHPVHTRGFMLFKPQPSNFFILGMRKFRARVDGNTLILQGPYLYMNRLLKMLKKYEQSGN
ncbi:MAG: adenylate/guanylate cyclase domain-containing protein [Lentimicrobiaceae bacterium]|nr:adenylate/guanylate cyclase domain-containing protein [Lentimicrobiaceae bacterium]